MEFIQGLNVSRSFTGICNTSAISIKVSREIEVGILGASILLIWVRLMPDASADCAMAHMADAETIQRMREESVRLRKR